MCEIEKEAPRGLLRYILGNARKGGLSSDRISVERSGL